MKIALLGDVHGNHLALAAVLNAARRQGVEKLLVTGDLVGYYFWPREVLDLLAGWDLAVVRGNHEDMLARVRRDPTAFGEIERKYGTGLRTALEQLSPRQIAWLEELPHPLTVDIDGHRILLCHGAPWDVDHYVYPDASDADFERCAQQDCDIVVMGHTHYPLERTVGRTRIVNPGSVGQPRNRQPGAHWALLDTGTARVEAHREDYDIAWIMDRARELQPQLPYLWKVLART
jgi:putative phosphoesterase